VLLLCGAPINPLEDALVTCTGAPLGYYGAPAVARYPQPRCFIIFAR
jgi:hypothetical protein